MTEAIRYIFANTTEREGEEHDKLMDDRREAFIVPTGMCGDQSQAKRTEPGRRNVKRTSIDVSTERQVIGSEPHPDFEGVVRGTADTSIPRRFTRALTTNAMDPPSSRQSLYLRCGRGSAEIPENFRNDVVPLQHFSQRPSGSGQSLTAASSLTHTALPLDSSTRRANFEPFIISDDAEEDGEE
ncbi:hypothetical protein LTR62_000557 [Meristemomyces frigidus]|uniref:Uncharacterized protein n=1 Tax=Meristemomyces frigidus TaxID=1508187 RepID=A0AAN7THM5_9PEZI|nr:hypothetical protein LTR62_000557 [Meristemomyces frigidus]